MTEETNKIITKLLSDLESDVNDFSGVSIKTSEQYTVELDDLMKNLYKIIIKAEDVETVILERYYLELTNLLYFMAQRVEKLNVYSDLAKAKARETYNKHYLDYCSDKDDKGKSIRTVNENTALAEQETKYEGVVENIYRSAYTIAKNKVQAGFEMVNTLRKVLSNRGLEMQLGLQPVGNKSASGYTAED